MIGRSGYLNLFMSTKNVETVMEVEIQHKMDHRPTQNVANVFSLSPKYGL